MKLDLQHPSRYQEYAHDPGPYGVYIFVGAILLGLVLSLMA